MESQYVQVFLLIDTRCWKKQTINAEGGGVKLPGVLRNNRELKLVAGSKKRQMALTAKTSTKKNPRL